MLKTWMGCLCFTFTIAESHIGWALTKNGECAIEIQALLVRATGHKTPGESSVNITDCNYDTTHLQENPQRLG